MHFYLIWQFPPIIVFTLCLSNFIALSYLLSDLYLKDTAFFSYCISASYNFHTTTVFTGTCNWYYPFYFFSTHFFFVFCSWYPTESNEHSSFWAQFQLLMHCFLSFLTLFSPPQMEYKWGELSVDRPIRSFEGDYIIRRVPPIILMFCFIWRGKFWLESVTVFTVFVWPIK